MVHGISIAIAIVSAGVQAIMENGPGGSRGGGRRCDASDAWMHADASGDGRATSQP